MGIANWSSLLSKPFGITGVSDTDEYDGGDDFDVGFLLADPTYCRKDDFSPCGEGDPIYQWLSTTGFLSLTPFSISSGYTLQKRNGLWVARGDGSGSFRSMTRGTMMIGDCTFGGVIDVNNSNSLISCFGDTIFSVGVRRAFNLVGVNMSFSGLIADATPGASGALTVWANTLEIIDFATSEVEFRKDSAPLGSIATTNPLVSFTEDTICLGSNAGGSETWIGDIYCYGFKSSKLAADRLIAYETFAQAAVTALL